MLRKSFLLLDVVLFLAFFNAVFSLFVADRLWASLSLVDVSKGVFTLFIVFNFLVALASIVLVVLFLFRGEAFFVKRELKVEEKPIEPIPAPILRDNPLLDVADVSMYDSKDVVCDDARVGWYDGIDDVCLSCGHTRRFHEAGYNLDGVWCNCQVAGCLCDGFVENNMDGDLNGC